ncbi:cAMP-dependent protein kinase catalytic subunit alpha [Mycena indigotica]|uniref:non-specific serine/threonine protein kinase n=1 Tax=Mycena indigotica TaxID=2126181 RepID=A0A8H6SYU7_9AGAR|nr:cAMP-dependent protein kinase catalytic subunit alpha [Mycena indigotica]KAF7307297.1 cAMP-dependent protein kinase catalytic subunit alpha [Mycena indigotica]
MFFIPIISALASFVVHHFAPTVVYSLEVHTAHRGLVVHSRGSILHVSGPVETGLILYHGDLVVYTAPINFINPPLPPPPPPDPVFDAFDRFATPTFIEGTNPRNDWMSPHIVSALVFSVFVTAFAAGSSLKPLHLQLAWDTSCSLPLQFIVDGQFTINALQQALRYIVVLGSKAALQVFEQLLPLFKQFTFTAFVLLRILTHFMLSKVVPWIWTVSLKAITITYRKIRSRAARRQGTPNEPHGPQYDASAAARAPIDKPPPRPPPPPVPFWTSWAVLFLCDVLPIRIHPKNIKIEKILGKGGFGTVELGIDTSTGASIAVKRIKKNLIREKFKLVTDEVRTMSRVTLAKNGSKYTNILGSFVNDTEYIIVMNYLPGDTMWERVPVQGLARPIALFYSAQLFLGINALHKLGIAHHDIKPNNLLLDSNGQLIISDFGVAARFDMTLQGGKSWEWAKKHGGDDFPLLWPCTDNPHICESWGGTPMYIAPEAMAHGARVSYGVDYWAFGVCYYFFLTGMLPYAYDAPRGDYADPLSVDMDDGYVERPFVSTIDSLFVYQMLRLNDYNRLSVHEMRTHEAWGDINWAAVENGVLLEPAAATQSVGTRVGRIR